MSLKRTSGTHEDPFLARLRAAALVASLVGAVGSVSLMLYAGRRNNSRTLMLFMAIWVLSPFIALAWATLISKHWPALTQATISGAMLVLTLVSLTIYGLDALRPAKKAAFVFVVVPPTAWLVISIAVFLSGKLSRRSGGA